MHIQKQSKEVSVASFRM